MTWLISAKQYIPAVIGEPFGGGYFAGYISHTANGNPTHALIVAPRATGATGTGYTLTTNLQWKTSTTTTIGATSAFDGVANTAAIVTAGIANHPAAQFCVSLNIGGFTDWYLPSRLEMDIAFSNLKPTTTANTSAFNTSNIYAVPRRNTSHLASFPAQTYVAAFAGGSEAFSVSAHWASEQTDAAIAYAFAFSNGAIGGGGGQTKTNTAPIRAFRRIAL